MTLQIIKHAVFPLMNSKNPKDPINDLILDFVNAAEKILAAKELEGLK